MTPDEPRAVPAGMKPWNGGDRAPDDWDGGPVQLRGSSVSNLMLPFKNMRWSCKDAMGDIIAYTPRPTEQPAPDDGVEQWNRAVDGLEAAAGRVNDKIDRALRSALSASTTHVESLRPSAAPSEVERDSDWFKRNANVRDQKAFIRTDPAYFAMECAAAITNGTLARSTDVPAGMVLVPREPTEAIAAAFYGLADEDVMWPIDCEQAWSAMIAAAPAARGEG